jgi:hypothetical protein
MPRLATKLHKQTKPLVILAHKALRNMNLVDGVTKQNAENVFCDYMQLAVFSLFEKGSFTFYNDAVLKIEKKPVDIEKNIARLNHRYRFLKDKNFLYDSDLRMDYSITLTHPLMKKNSFALCINRQTALRLKNKINKEKST